MEMLHSLVNGETTFLEVREKASAFRALEVIKRAFVHTTDSNTWENAQQLFPHHATEERLRTFASLSFKGGLLSVFRDYCCSAMLAVESLDMEVGHSAAFTANGCTVTIVQLDSVAETAEQIRKQLSAFSGASLAVAIIRKVSCLSIDCDSYSIIV